MLQQALNVNCCQYTPYKLSNLFKKNNKYDNEFCSETYYTTNSILITVLNQNIRVKYFC